MFIKLNEYKKLVEENERYKHLIDSERENSERLYQESEKWREKYNEESDKFCDIRDKYKDLEFKYRFLTDEDHEQHVLLHKPGVDGSITLLRTLIQNEGDPGKENFYRKIIGKLRNAVEIPKEEK